MRAEMETLIPQALDGSLTEEGRRQLNDALRHDAAAREAWCRQLHLDALLTWRAGAETGPVQVLPESGREDGKITAFPKSFRRWHWAGWAAAAALAVGLLLFMFTPGRSEAAMVQILAALERGDRSYVITVLEGDARQTMNNGRTLTYEGAELYLREHGQFVLIRPILEGGRRITGSDGTVNWDFTGDSPVKVSRDLNRFRGGLPGEQQDAAFLDLRGQLSRLQDGYDTTLSDATGEPELRRLTARKKSREVRGPNEISLTFRRDSGVMVRMEMRGLPRAKGGPAALRLTLRSESPLPENFFTHVPHHELSRPVEDADKPAHAP